MERQVRELVSEVLELLFCSSVNGVVNGIILGAIVGVTLGFMIGVILEARYLQKCDMMTSAEYSERENILEASYLGHRYWNGSRSVSPGDVCILGFGEMGDVL